MIIQWIIDWFRDVVEAWIIGVPQPPAVLWDLRTWLVSGGVELNTLVSKFGVVVPFVAFGNMLSAWLSIVTFWLVMLGVRAGLWAFNR